MFSKQAYLNGIFFCLFTLHAQKKKNQHNNLLYLYV